MLSRFMHRTSWLKSLVDSFLSPEQRLANSGHPILFLVAAVITCVYAMQYFVLERPTNYKLMSLLFNPITEVYFTQASARPI
jgi:hypothetical protein